MGIRLSANYPGCRVVIPLEVACRCYDNNNDHDEDDDCLLPL